MGAKAKAKAEPKSKAKAKAKPEAKVLPMMALEPAAERRIDPADGKAYALSEMRSFYSGRFNKKEFLAYWTECKIKPQAKAKAKAKPKAVVHEVDPSEPPWTAYPASWDEAAMASPMM